MLVRARHSFKGCFFFFQRASLIAQLVKNLPAMQETQVRFLGQGDLFEKEMATTYLHHAESLLQHRGFSPVVV